MKSNYLIIFTLLTSLLIGACEKPNPPVPKPPIDVEQDTIFELLWATRMDMKKEIVNLNNGQEYKNWFLYSGNLGEPPTIMAFNKETGNKDWVYTHKGTIQDEIDFSTIVGNIYIGKCSSGIIAVNLDTRVSIWEINFDPFHFASVKSLIIEDGFLYHHGGKNYGLPNEKTVILKINILTGEWEEFYTDNRGVGISPVSFCTDAETGKKIMIFNVSPNAGEPPEITTQNIRAVDIETKETVWEVVNFTDHFASNIEHPPIIYDNRIVITGGDWSIYAFDVHTGKQLWKYAFDYPWSIWNKTNHLIYKDRLYVNNGQFDVTCLNPETGALIWNNPKGGPNCTDNMIYYEKEDLLVFTSWGYGSVMVLDALTGETI